MYPKFLPELVHVLTEYGAVLLAEINMLKQTVRRCNPDRSGLDKEPAAEPIFVQCHYLARFNLPDELGADCIERTALTCRAVISLLSLTNTQRPDSIWVSRHLNPVREKKQQTICALQMIKNMSQRIRLCNVARLGQKMTDNFRIRRSFEDAPVSFVLITKKRRIDNIAVMSNRHLTARVFRKERLGIHRLA